MKPHSVTGDGYILKTTRVYRNFRIAEEKQTLVSENHRFPGCN